MYDALLTFLRGRGLFDGITVEDAAAEQNEPKERSVKLFMNNILEDTKGLPHPVCNSFCPANIGMCPLCTTRGLQVFKRPCYLGAVTRLYRRCYCLYVSSTYLIVLPKCFHYIIIYVLPTSLIVVFTCVIVCFSSTQATHQAIVQRGEDEFSGMYCKVSKKLKKQSPPQECPHCQTISEILESKPRKMTTAMAIASGRRSRDAVRELKENPRRGLKTKVKKILAEEPFRDVSVFLEHFGYDWDIINRIAVDPSHQFNNLCKDLLALLTNSGRMSFKKKYLDFEQTHGRFLGMTLQKKKKKKKPKKKKKRKKANVNDPDSSDDDSEFLTSEDEYEGGAPWHVSEKFKNILGALISYLQNLIPNGWPAMSNFFSDEYQKLKIAEGLLFMGDVGCYLLGLTDLPSDVKKVFIDVVRISGKFLLKQNQPGQLRKLQKEMVL
jgi:hypothetical protein